MATLTLTYDTGSVSLATIINAICSTHGYSATRDDGTPNPETQAAFAKRMVGQYVIDMVRQQAQRDALVNINSITLT
jgi:hypothetical protein